MLVYVLNKYGKPLMPCKASKAKKLLKKKMAIVKQIEPFTLQLLYGSAGYKQEITIGVDIGSLYIGLSASTKIQELFSSEVVLRNDIVKNISTRKEARRNRRLRKTRYRKPKYQNRTKNKGLVAPSIKNKIQMHVKVIRNTYKILPICKMIIEIAPFDIQKVQAQESESIRYQDGYSMEFGNLRQFVLWRDNHECQFCHGKTGDKILNVHHIESRKIGGNSIDNLITLCKTCHNNYHNGKIKLKIKRENKYRDATAVNYIQKNVCDELTKLGYVYSITYGYITKYNRLKMKLPKHHYIDAFCIAKNLNAHKLNYYYLQKQVRKTNRQIHKFKILKGNNKRINQAPKYVFGFQLYDKVKYKNRYYYVFARRKTGGFDIRDLNNNKINNGWVSYKYLSLVETRKSMLVQKEWRLD